jgi:spermidine synthase
MCAYTVNASRGGHTAGDRSAVSVMREADRVELMFDGVVQSIDLASAHQREYWSAMLPDQPPRSAILLGAGGGTLAALLQQRFGVMPVLAIDNDPEVIAAGRRDFYLTLPGVQVVLADAFRFIACCRGRFDYIAVDLFRGGERPREVTGRPFLRDLRRVLTPRGSVAVNLFRDRRTETAIERLSRGFSIARRHDAGRNVVLHLRATR